MRRLVLLLPLVLALLLAAGCGGGDDTAAETSASDGGEPLSKSEWIEQADAICAGTDAETDELEAEIEELEGGPEDVEALAQLAGILRAGGEVIRNQVNQLRELEPPADDEETIDEMLSTVEANAALAESMADSLESGEIEEFEGTNEEADANNTTAKQMAEDYGLEVCGSAAE